MEIRGGRREVSGTYGNLGRRRKIEMQAREKMGIVEGN
jgi:hypothetical protein